MEIRYITFAELEGDKDFEQLVKEYADEGTIEGLTHKGLDKETYRAKQAAGILHIKAVYIDNNLIGFTALSNIFLPHHGVVVTFSDGLFVFKEYRNTRAGMILIREAEKYAAESKTEGVLMGAPVEGALIEILPHLDYVETTRLFFKKVKYGQ